MKLLKLVKFSLLVVGLFVTPVQGGVSETYSLAQTPLERSGTVPPNVVVLLDDSGSMDMNLVVSGDDVNGGMLVNNAAIATNNEVEITISYLWDLDNVYPPSSGYGLIAPTEDALNANPDMVGNQYGIWRTRNHKFNKTYYAPTIYYAPWSGQDHHDVVFGNADPNAIRLDPVDADDTWDMLGPHTYNANSFPKWGEDGGSARVTVDNLYVPFYYSTTADAPIAWHDLHTKVEILAGSTYTGGPNRDDCRPGDGDPTVCTYAQEIQNFANYMQYYRHREYVTKGALGQVIEGVTKLRLGFDTVSNRSAIDVADMNDIHTGGNKKALLDTLYRFDSYGGTPLRQLLARGSKMLGCQVGGNCPALAAPAGNCQQNFALLFTDGYWNGGTGISTNTDVDGAGPYDGGRYADTVSQTLADVAMEYYENDLFPSVDNEVPVGRRDIAGAPAGTFDGVDTMHQHVKTYGIAFGVEGTIDAAVAQAWDVGTAYAWPDPFGNTLHKLDDVVHTAVNGRGDFLSAGNPEELQAAIKSAFLEFTQAASSASGGTFSATSLRDGALLYRGFYDLRERTGELTATQVSNTGVIAATPDWYASQALDVPGKLPTDRVIVTWNPLSAAGVPFRYASLAPVQQVTLDRDQLDYMRGDRRYEQPHGDLRTRLPRAGLLGSVVNSSPVFVGQPSGINRDQAPYPTDDLYSDFVSNYASRTEVVYVGANDGMMHGFAANNGEEIFAYVPNMLIDSSKAYSNKLNDYTSPFYHHNYYVDLSPRFNDVYSRPRVAANKQWMTTLVGGLGSGGKGYFALNVTDPATLYASESSAANAVLWEFTDEDDTYPTDSDGHPVGGTVGAITDADGNPGKELGYATSLPLVALTNLHDGGVPARNEWGVIFGNGANSTAGYATLFVLLHDKGIDGWASGDFIKIPTDYGPALPGEQQAGYANGLGAPTAVDADLNGTMDYVYAGDRLGNLFRFDLTSDDSNDWHAVHLFKATYNDGVDDIIQAVTNKPLVIKNPHGLGLMIVFGTGSYLTNNDASNTEIQSIYGIWDRLDSAPATTNTNTKADRLVQQTITNVVDDSGAVAITRRIVSRNGVGLVADGSATDTASTGTYGWYIDLAMVRASDTIAGSVNPDPSGLAPPDPQFPGERAVRRLVFRNGALITTTVLPATDEFACSGVRPGSVLVLDAFTGGDLQTAIIDFNQDGYVDSNDLIDVAGESYSGGVLFNQGDLDGALVDLSTLGGAGDTDFLFISGGNDTEGYRIEGTHEGRTGRLSWVELDHAN